MTADAVLRLPPRRIRRHSRRPAFLRLPRLPRLPRHRPNSSNRNARRANRIAGKGHHRASRKNVEHKDVKTGVTRTGATFGATAAVTLAATAVATIAATIVATAAAPTAAPAHAAMPGSASKDPRRRHNPQLSFRRSPNDPRHEPTNDPRQPRPLPDPRLPSSATSLARSRHVLHEARPATKRATKGTAGTADRARVGRAVKGRERPRGNRVIECPAVIPPAPEPD